MSQPVFIGLDVGTTGVKATAFDTECRPVCSALAELPMLSPAPGAAEQDPQNYVDTAFSVLAECVAKARIEHRREVAAVAISAIIGSLVVLDKDCQPLGQAFTWADLRCTQQVHEAEQALGHDNAYRATGCQIHSIYTGPKIAWLSQADPERFAAGRWFVPLKSLLLHRLTGRMLLDRSVGSGSGLLGIGGLQWDPAWLDHLGVEASCLGELVESDTQVEFLPAAARRLGLPMGTPLIVGAADGMLSSLGVGAIGEGVYTAMIATSAACRTVDDRPILHPERATWSYYLADGLWVNGGAISSAGIVYRWVRDTFFADSPDGDGYRAINAAAERAPAGAEGLLLLPYLAGERTPNWNADARGMLLGLTLGHSREHIARAVMESISLHLTQVMVALRQICTQPTQVRTTGGYRGSKFWVQMLADCLDCELSLPAEGDASVLGAALLAMRARGAIGSLHEARKLVPVVSIVRPDPNASKYYRAQLARFEDFYAVLSRHFGVFAT